MKQTKNILALFLILLIVALSSCSSTNSGGGDLPPTISLEQGTLISPKNATTCSPVDIKLEWEKALLTGSTDAIIYDVYLGETEASMTKQGSVSVTATTYEIKSLNPSSTYYWRIESRVGDKSSTSGTYHFQTTGESVASHQPDEPSSPDPSYGSVLTSISSVSLSWTCSDVDDGDVLTYAVYLADNYELQNPLNVSNVRPTATGGTADATVTQGIYYWQVKVTDGVGNTNLSPVWRFEVQ